MASVRAPRGRGRVNHLVADQGHGSVELDELAQSCPLLALLGAFVHVSDRQRVEEYLEEKKQKNIKMPYWVACFAIKNDRPCLGLNHRAGYGCNRHFCDFNHVCLVCGKDGHGMWQLKDDHRFRCCLRNDIQSQLDVCKLEVEGFLKAIERDTRLANFDGQSPRQLLRDLRNRNTDVVDRALLQMRFEDFPALRPSGGGEWSTPSTPTGPGLSGGPTSTATSTEAAEYSDHHDEPGDAPEETYVIGKSQQLKIVWNKENIICRREQANSTVMEGTFFSFGLARPVAVKLVNLPGINEADRATETSKRQMHIETVRLKAPQQFTVELLTCEDILLPENFIGGHKLAVVMERCAMNLADWVRINQERLNDRNTLREVVRQLLQAYNAWHKTDLAHCEVKPTNVLVKENSDGTVQLKLCDLENSKHAQAGGTKSTFTEVGTCDDYGCWWSPKDRRVSDGKYERVPAESWPIGCMLHFIATGRSLFHYPGNEKRSIDTAREAGDNEELRLEHLRQAGLHDNIPLLYDLVEKMVRKRDACLPGDALKHPFLWDRETIEYILHRFSQDFHDGKAAEHKLQMCEELNDFSEFRNWPQQLDEDLVQFLNPNTLRTRSYLSQPCCDQASHLIKMVRNLCEHFNDNAPEDTTDWHKENFFAGLTRCFPKLLLPLFDTAARYGEWHFTVYGGLRFDWHVPALPTMARSHAVLQHSQTPLDEDMLNKAQSGTAEEVQELLRRNGNPNAKDQLGNTPLHWAAWVNPNVEMVRHLLEAGADINAKNKNGETPLIYAACKGDLLIVEVLCAHKADTTISQQGRTACQWAQVHRHPRVVAFLQQHQQ